MNVLSLHSAGHDTGVGYFEDGRLVYAVETERLTRVKHDHRSDLALHHVLARPEVDPARIELVAVSTPVRGSLLRIPDLDRAMERIGAGAPHHRTVCELLGRRVACVVVTHEVSHGALAAHYAGHAEGTTVLVNEGRGQITRSSLFQVRDGRLEWVEKDPLPWYGNGFGWTAIGHLFGHGLGPSVAGKVMALGGYGSPDPRIRETLLAVDPRVMHDLELARRVQEELSVRPEFARDFERMASVVATHQELFTEAVHTVLDRHAVRTGSGVGPIALGGGCALNIVANSVLRQRFGRDIAVPPACGDAGHLVGAGIYALKYLHGVDTAPFDVCANGGGDSRAAALEALADAGLTPLPYDGDAVARTLADGGVVAHLEGRAELGPRALGHRSLLGNPAVPGMRKRMSEELKQREWYRPLGAMMRAERFAELYPGEHPSPHMLFEYPLPEGTAPEARHVNGTCRIQTLGPEEPRLHALLTAFEALTGVPALINTSLNGPGRAIAHTARDVLDDFARTGVDLYVFDEVMAYRAGAERAR
ncbi:carbamoyltransferase C-terminal domain-containing protein [Streptomyces clavuligerus]|uniref:Moenomycin biosynthesis protein MoeM5 n=1 Tax=Streptomyces clavuligerus TaxID=1901 RepID=B5H1F9_STRCL|nr:carbamoyltransferase C-terminal domain-containing protein [Streptomyces clavuligerus]EDY52405.1 MoeM5 [Streptomyces clavuligerus]EFG04770.1 Moenomycin biosynthesis protein MoeM5 [Streptomyces clavuligerus]MBY6306782.1 carbamoyltransferase [Streptomyces clavuligerus]QCS10615.1 carbamoyltransferase [Streptomyces clavuligerus]QPJ97347.1 carbamoyltransferase [Streptomyces clavuligerus]